MNLSLRKRVLLILVAVNAAVAALLFGYLTPEVARFWRAGALQVSQDVVYAVRGTIQPQGRLNVARILQWPFWPQFADAVIVDSNLSLGPGGWQPQGVALNPLGSLGRSSEIDRGRVYEALAMAVRSGAVVDEVEGGRAVPIEVPGGVWGACWYRVRNAPSVADLLWRYFLPGFLISTVLLSAGTFFALSRFVLDPLGRLARGARTVAAGDLSVRVAEPARKDEIADLIRGFNSMTAEVEGFNKRLAQEVEHAREEARRAEAAAMTQRRLAAMGELAAGIAHEINNPLGGLENAVEVLAREQLPPDKRRQYFQLLAGGLERIRLTVGRLLHLAPREARSTEFALVEPVGDAIALVAHRAARAKVEIVLGDGKPGSPEEVLARLARLPRFIGKSHELGQAVLNLLVNALDALEELPDGGGRIEVRLEREGDALALSVSDNGPGVPADALPRVADLFYTTKAPGKGTGLGLAIVHNVAVAHGGGLELESRPGAGFRATLRLPLRGASQGGPQA